MNCTRVLQLRPTMSVVLDSNHLIHISLKILNLGGAMAEAGGPDVVDGALARAAQRAQRLVELDHAHFIIQRDLRMELPLDTLCWGEVMSMS